MDGSTTLSELLLSSWDDVPSNVHGPKVPTIGPRRHYIGARNVATVKDGSDPIRPEDKAFLTKLFMLKQ
jgi:hypothetical protein